MKWFCLVLAALIYLPSHALIEDDAANLLSFEELHYLTPEARVQYFREVRLALSELENSPISSQSEKSALLQLRTYFEQFAAALNPLEVAEAATCPDHYKPIGPNHVCGRLPADGETCGESITDPSGTKYCRYSSKATATIVAKPADAAKSAAEGPHLDDGEVVQGAKPTSPPKPRELKPEPLPKKEAKPVAAHLPAQPPALTPAPKKPTDDGKKCPSREEARAAFYHDKPAHCLIGGNLSTYIDAHPAVGKCQSVSTFPTDKKAGEEGTISCPQHQNLCNPLLYCDSAKNKKFQPLCRMAKQDLTDACERGTRAAEKVGTKCDPFTNLNLPGLHEEWNKFRKAIRGLCKQGSSFQAYFCTECEKVKARLAAAKPAQVASRGAATPDHPIPPAEISNVHNPTGVESEDAPPIPHHSR